MNLRAIKGMNDILPEDIERWHRVEGALRAMAAVHRYTEIRTPVVEATSLFVRSIGEATDIVEKEMYSFERHGDGLTLRPEGTAGAARAYLEHSVHTREPVTRWCYSGPMFRAENVQRGRYRQFYQFGCEVFGDPGPAVDAEMIDMLVRFFDGLGIPDVKVHLNSLGMPATRARYRDALVAHLTPQKDRLSEESKRRLETNPLRILDSKDPRDIAASEGAPSMLEVLDEADRAHFDGLRKYLDKLGTPYVVEPKLVRGLDYYTRTLFELRSTAGELGTQNALLGGGRYNNMIHDLGGPEVPAIGFAVGIERILLALPPSEPTKKPCVLLAPLGEGSAAEALLLARELRDAGVPSEVEGRGGSLKSMLRRANALGAAYCLVVGEAEIARGVVQVKDLAAHTQEDLPRAGLAKLLADRVGPGPAPGGV